MKLALPDYIALIALATTAQSLEAAAARAQDEYSVEMRRHGLDPRVPHKRNHETLDISPMSPTPPDPIPAMPIPASLAAARRRRK